MSRFLERKDPCSRLFPPGVVDCDALGDFAKGPEVREEREGTW